MPGPGGTVVSTAYPGSRPQGATSLVAKGKEMQLHSVVKCYDGVHGSSDEKAADLRRAQKSSGGRRKEKAKNETRHPHPIA